MNLQGPQTELDFASKFFVHNRHSLKTAMQKNITLWSSHVIKTQFRGNFLGSPYK